MDNRRVIYNIDINGQNWQGAHNLCIVCLDRLAYSYRTNYFVTDSDVKCERCNSTKQ